MKDLFLAEPDKKYQKSFENYAIAYKLLQEEVKTSTFWLIDKTEVVGVVRIRHEEVEYAGHIGYDISPEYRNRGYGFQILKLALEKARNIGIDEAILTCNIDNIASEKIIVKNNGKLLGTIFDKEEKEYLHKYSIALATN